MDDGEAVAPPVVGNGDDLEFNTPVVATDVDESVALSERVTRIGHCGEDPSVPDAMLPSGPGDPNAHHRSIVSHTYGNI